MGNTQNYDVVIAGGGMVGLSLALTLAAKNVDKPLAILVVDQSPYLRKPERKELSNLQYHPSFDARSTALSKSSVEHYRAIGVFDALSKHAEDIKKIHVSDKGHIGSALLDAEEFSLDTLGCVVENHWLGKVLLQKTAEFSNIELRSQTRAVDLSVKANSVTVSLTKLDKHGHRHSENTNDNVAASLLVVADGASSILRSCMGIDVTRVSYQQSAIIANIQTQNAHDGVAFERFTPDGAVALLPLPDLLHDKNRAALVWTLPSDRAAKMDSVAEPEFLSELTKTFGNRLGVFTSVGARHLFPLALEQANEEYRRRIVILGNAAHTLHPVAGQSFNLSLRDAAALSNCVLAACQHDQDIGSLEVLESYSSRQLDDKKKTIGFSHYLTQLYQNQLLPVQFGRNAGLLLLDMLLLPKESFVRRTAGVAGAGYLE